MDSSHQCIKGLQQVKTKQKWSRRRSRKAKADEVVEAETKVGEEAEDGAGEANVRAGEVDAEVTVGEAGTGDGMWEWELGKWRRSKHEGSRQIDAERTQKNAELMVLGLVFFC